MSDRTTPPRKRRRLDPGARERLLGGMARAGGRQRAPAPEPEPSAEELRRILAEIRSAAASAAADEAGPATEAATRPVPAGDAPPGPPAAPAAPADRLPRVRDPWAGLRTIVADPDLMDRNLVITALRSDPAHGAFDVLRTRMVQAMADHRWRRVAITSPTKGCGKSFTAINLAVALSRYEQQKTVLLDLDLRAPALARLVGVRDAGSIGDMLRGLVPPESHLRRFAPNSMHIGPTLALGLNDRVEPFAAELFQDRAAAEALAGLQERFAPDIMLFDLPPALAQDDVIALRPLYDCVLMVIGGGSTTARELREATRRIGEDKPVLGIVLNKAGGMGLTEYSY